MSSTVIPVVPNDSAQSTTPPLEPGDRLTREEFERRYEAMPRLKKAELLEGVVHMPSPVRFKAHGVPSRELSTWMGNYQAATPGVLGADNSTARLDLDNEPQPDSLLLIDPALGGQARISADDYVVGGPELVGEIAASSASIDLNVKLHVYRRNEVREYIVWRVLDKAIDWFVSRQGRYDRIQPSVDGLVRSEVFPGLWLDPQALVRGNLAAVLATLQKGTASPEHAAFVAKLQLAAAQRNPS
jgi:hypothetical protein